MYWRQGWMDAAWVNNGWVGQDNGDGKRTDSSSYTGTRPDIYGYAVFGTNVPPPVTTTVCPYLLSNFPGFSDDARYAKSVNEQEIFGTTTAAVGRNLLLSTTAPANQTSPTSK